MADQSMFPVLLRHWRNARGLTQLDLAGASDVSARHISFLETGRARPSREMVLQLAAALDVPMREQNGLLKAAGFSEAYGEPGLGADLDPLVRRTIEQMMAQQEPYPLLAMDRHYDLVLANKGCTNLLAHVLGDRLAKLGHNNVLRIAFDPEGLRPFIHDWHGTARHLLLRLQREVLQNPADHESKQLLSALCSYPDVPADWRIPDLTTPSLATFNLELNLNGARYGFLTALTVFNAPQNITLEELKLESYFPLDEATERFCRDLADRS